MVVPPAQDLVVAVLLHKNILLKEALIIFARNPVLGKVKTRLAATMGDYKALSIYQSLLEYTAKITKELPCDLFVFYADGISLNDHWSDDVYQKMIQEGNDLGSRMNHAFNILFQQPYKRVLIIGTDCFELTSSIIKDAFKALDKHEVVIGPSADGGYYLLGMKQFYPFLFEEIAWSTDNVYRSTITKLVTNKISYQALTLLNDIDTEDDWNQYLTNSHR
jgi:rSAM/selenodomain-associated transferase 1